MSKQRPTLVQQPNGLLAIVQGDHLFGMGMEIEDAYRRLVNHHTRADAIAIVRMVLKRSPKEQAKAWEVALSSMGADVRRSADRYGGRHLGADETIPTLRQFEEMIGKRPVDEPDADHWRRFTPNHKPKEPSRPLRAANDEEEPMNPTPTPAALPEPPAEDEPIRWSAWGTRKQIGAYLTPCELSNLHISCKRGHRIGGRRVEQRKISERERRQANFPRSSYLYRVELMPGETTPEGRYMCPKTTEAPESFFEETEGNSGGPTLTSDTEEEEMTTPEPQTSPYTKAANDGRDEIQKAEAIRVPEGFKQALRVVEPDLMERPIVEPAVRALEVSGAAERAAKAFARTQVKYELLERIAEIVENHGAELVDEALAEVFGELFGSAA